MGKSQEDTSAVEDRKTRRAKGIIFTLGRNHQAYTAMPKNIPRDEDSYAWYIRIPDIIAFLRYIQPAHEKHLVGTVAEAYTGELNLNFYRSGQYMRFEAGRITDISRWVPETVEDGDAQFPYKTFWQLLCGRCRTNELVSRFADCSATDRAAVLLDCLLPPFTGEVRAIE